jgi:alpha-ketoglutaric semialdehyde dehydrogenase
VSASPADRPLSALLLVDLQRDYLELPGLEPSAQAIVARAQALLEGFRARGLPVIHVWTTVSREDDQRMRHWRRRDLWRCEEGTPGHRAALGLEPDEQEPIVHKAGFDAFAGGALDRLLDELHVERLLIAGMHLHACVREAVLGAHARERLAEVWVAEDAVTSDDPAHAAVTRRYLEARDVRFLPVATALAELDGDVKQASGAPPEVVHDAAARVRDAALRWRERPVSARAQLLERAADLLEPQAASIAMQMAEEIAKPVRFGELEVARAAEMLRAIARRCSDEAKVELVRGVEVRRRPLGVVAVITPWNNPVYIPLGKIAAGLVYGNGVLWKPAPDAQAIAERVVATLREAGLPDGLLALIAGDRHAAQRVMSTPAVDAVTVTGSSLAGFAAQEICAGRRIPLQAELGGNNAALVWSDADLEQAAREIAAGAFDLAGQRCTANRRVVVHHELKGELLTLLARETAALSWGDPRERLTRIGPMVGFEQRDRLAELIARSQLPSLVPHGADAPGGVRAAPWHPPTIVCCEEPGAEIVQRETFGPLLIVQSAADWAQAIELVNGVEQGLVAALFSSSPMIVARFLEEAQAGILKVNSSTADAEVDVPFGGWRQSGVGPPEHGPFDRDFYTRPQVVYR